MTNEIFIVCFGTAIALKLVWCFKNLPKEKWQIIGSVPVKKGADNKWKGINFTYYGLFNANAFALATTVFFVLLGGMGIPEPAILMTVAAYLGICMPASSLIAKLVEKKSYTFTVAGATFVGIIMGPWLILLLDNITGIWMGVDLPVIPVLASLSIAYTFGEGAGRLACISFGCCYGKPVCEVHPVLRRFFRKISFTFYGKTKKIAYAGGLEGERVIPVQAITSVIYIIAGLGGAYFFLRGHYFFAFMLTICITQLWRFLSEFLRADHRGGRKISAYQIMSITMVIYSAVILPFFPSQHPVRPDIIAGLKSLWTPGLILFIQGIWIVSFIFTGKSNVTGSSLSFHVIHENV
ncbi:MAG: prolipoprotein diacylglyceryl transferase [Thermodesulfobacteriota bacterium]|nr:prolipoprotein diacylglyceryl transferase [Thermodesulfobacteriota bacterium]